ncbi:HAD-IB family hydrolase [Zhongshania aliphaticivorans]|uniref:HAD-IB family hydrolase n=1 Tax=Zhongshania aliphaticivorans TaxID=1470434 RepID=UPI0012E6036B|nr:HAD-IB family hydrolase [Zhongshania aliphaticivorans]CAA0115482.1 putative phosphatase [Zhongshania aliphaticivorans]
MPIKSSTKGHAVDKQTAAFFDFDGTLIAGYSAFYLLKEQIKRKLLGRHQITEVILGLVNYRAHLIDADELMSIGSSHLKGMLESDFADLGKQVYEKNIFKLIYPEARALIEKHRQQGHQIVIVSSASQYQLTDAAKELGIDHILCTQYQVKDGSFTGEVISPVCWGDGKVRAANNFAAEHGIDLDQSYFYSDSDEDLPLLEAVGHPRPLNPNKRLTKIAKKNNWPCQTFGSRSRGLSKTLRSVGVYTSLISAYFGGLGVSKLSGSSITGRNFMVSSFSDFVCALIQMELKVRNPEHMANSGPAVVIFNHQSQADGFIIMKLLRDNFAGIGKKEFGKFRLLANAYEFAGIIPIDRSDSKNTIDLMKPLVDTLQIEGRSVAIAPEGTRSSSMKPGPFKKGAFHLAIDAGVPILPVVIHNTADVQAKGDFLFHPATVTVEILPAVNTTTWRKETLDAHINEVRNQFLTALGFPAENTVGTKSATQEIAAKANVTAAKPKPRTKKAAPKNSSAKASDSSTSQTDKQTQ